MSKFNSASRRTVLLVCACAAGISIAAVPGEVADAVPFAGAIDAPRHRLLDRTIDLHPERDRVVVVGHDGVSPPLVADFALAADAPGLPPGWAVWSLPSTTPEDQRIAAMARLRELPQLAFTSPIYRCVDGHWRIATPDLLVGLVDGDVTTIATLMEDFVLPVDALVASNVGDLATVVRLRPAVRAGDAIVRLADKMTDHPLVRFAEPDFLGAGMPGGSPEEGAPGGDPVNDPQFPSQWGLHDVGQSTLCGGASSVVDVDLNAPEAWTMMQADPSLIVLVLDNGIQFDHPDLLGDPELGHDFTPDTGGGWPVHACDNHGTAVVGVLAASADDGIGIAGLAHGVRFASARIAMPGATCQLWTVQSSWVAEALAWGESIGATVSNTSWALLPSSIITEAYAQRAANGMLHVASSHNLALPSVAFPASLPTVIAVGAIGRSGALASFSNWGEKQELVAPGVQIRTTDRTGGAGYGSGSHTCVEGTSFAAPLVAATAVLVRSMNPALDVDAVRAILQTSTTDLGLPGWDPEFGHGLLRADVAVLTALALLPNPADLNGDGIVDGADLGLLLSLWETGATQADLNGDGVVDGVDLGLLLNAWGD